MIKVGLTGGIGSGKSFVAKYFEKIGIPVYNSDSRGKYLMDSNEDVKKKLIAAFGEQTFKNNKLNRAHLAQIVFNNKQKLSAINNIVHPAVQKDFEEWCENKKSFPYIIKEAAILIESNAHKKLNYLIVVTAPKNIRIRRVVERDNLSINEVEKRIASQINDEKRLLYANFIVNNDGTKLVEEQVRKIDSILKQKKK